MEIGVRSHKIVQPRGLDFRRQQACRPLLFHRQGWAQGTDQDVIDTGVQAFDALHERLIIRGCRILHEDIQDHETGLLRGGEPDQFGQPVPRSIVGFPSAPPTITPSFLVDVDESHRNRGALDASDGHLDPHGQIGGDVLDPDQDWGSPEYDEGQFDGQADGHVPGEVGSPIRRNLAPTLAEPPAGEIQRSPKLAPGWASRTCSDFGWVVRHDLSGRFGLDRRRLVLIVSPFGHLRPQ